MNVGIETLARHDEELKQVSMIDELIISRQI